jgi:hypothetical protein
LDYSWFVIFALLTWLLAINYYPTEFKNWPPLLYWLMGTVTAVTLFIKRAPPWTGALCGCAAVQNFGVQHYAFPLRGCPQIGEEPPNAIAEFLIASAGPVIGDKMLAVFRHHFKPSAGHSW